MFLGISNLHLVAIVFFFSSRRRHTRCSRDRSSDVCSSDLARELGKGKCLAQLLSGPICGRVGGHIEVQDATPVMGQHQKYVKRSEERRVGKESSSRWWPYH